MFTAKHANVDYREGSDHSNDVARKQPVTAAVPETVTGAMATRDNGAERASASGDVADDGTDWRIAANAVMAERVGRHRGGDGPMIVPRDAADSAEIEALSDRVRQAMECPVCWRLDWDLSCLCPNGHVVCGGCLQRVWNRDAARHCPLCRAQLSPTPDAQVTAAKVAEVVANVMVACAHRPLGCPALCSLYDVAGHEAECAHAPDVRCLVSTCQWIGFYDELFEHVCRVHNDVAVDTAVIGYVCLPVRTFTLQGSDYPTPPASQIFLITHTSRTRLP